MKFSKELIQRIDKELKELEEKEKEGKVKWYSEKEAMQLMFGEHYIEKKI